MHEVKVIHTLVAPVHIEGALKGKQAAQLLGEQWDIVHNAYQDLVKSRSRQVGWRVYDSEDVLDALGSPEGCVSINLPVEAYVVHGVVRKAVVHIIADWYRDGDKLCLNTPREVTLCTHADDAAWLGWAKRMAEDSWYQHYMDSAMDNKSLEEERETTNNNDEESP